MLALSANRGPALRSSARHAQGALRRQGLHVSRIPRGRDRRILAADGSADRQLAIPLRRSTQVLNTSGGARERPRPGVRNAPLDRATSERQASPAARDEDGQEWNTGPPDTGRYCKRTEQVDSPGRMWKQSVRRALLDLARPERGIRRKLAACAGTSVLTS
jgi:hypothetical protein